MAYCFLDPCVEVLSKIVCNDITARMEKELPHIAPDLINKAFGDYPGNEWQALRILLTDWLPFTTPHENVNFWAASMKLEMMLPSNSTSKDGNDDNET